ncbi:unnamed protein product, partial [Closterium sp. NIES-53]
MRLLPIFYGCLRSDTLRISSTSGPVSLSRRPRPHSVFSSQDVTFDESACYYMLHPHASRPGPAPSGVSQVDPPPLVEPLEVSSDSSGPAKGVDPAADDTAATRRSPRLETPPGFLSRPSSPPPQPAAVDSGAVTAGAEPGGAETEGEGSGGAGSGGAKTRGAGSWGAATGGADFGGPASPSGSGAMGDPVGGPGAGQPPQPDLLETLSPQAICALIVRRGCPGGGGYGPAGAGAASPRGTAGAGGTVGTAGAGGTGGTAGAGGAARAGGTRGAAGAAGAGATSPRGATGAGGAGPTSPGGTVGAGGAGGGAGARGAGVGGTGGAGAAGPGGARTGGAGAAGAGGAVRAGGAGAARAGGIAGARGARGATKAVGTGGARGSAGAGGAEAGGIGDTGGTGGGSAAGARGAAGAAGAGGAGAAGAGGSGAAGTALRRPFFYSQPQWSLPPPDLVLRHVLSLPSSTGLPLPLMCPPTDQSQPHLLLGSPLPAPAPHTEVTESLTERREPETRASTPVRARHVALPRPPAVPGTHGVALRPSSVPQRVVLPEPPASSLPHVPDPESDLARAA